MRPTLRSLSTRFAMMATTVLTMLALAGPAHADFTLYGGLYSTDVSSSAPTGLAPANGTVLSYPGSPISLAWRQVPGSTNYQVQIARQQSSAADCSSSTAFQADNIIATATTTQTGWVPTQLDDANGSRLWTGTYCWRVRVEGSPPGQWSAANRLTRTWTATPTGLKFYNDHDGPIPRTSSSSDYATGSSVTRNAGYIQWNAVDGAATYEVEVSTSQSFSPQSVITWRDGLVDSRVNLLHLPDDTYFWRVRAVAPNGTEGPWSSGSNTFTVRWFDDSWDEPSKLWPADSSAQSEIRIGWTPMPGATYYEYQLGTNSACFWHPDFPSLAPYPYGFWTTKSPVFNDAGVMQYTYDPLPTHCRLSEIDATTMNNWVTINEAIGEEQWINIKKDCISDDGAIECEPAGLPDSQPDDWGASFHGAAESNGGPDPSGGRLGDGRYGSGYNLHWRVRPVYRVDQDSETGWKVRNDGYSVYGSWTRYSSGGTDRHHTFSFDPTSAVTSSVGTRCTGDYNAAGGCVTNVGSAMQADETPAVTIDRSMQFPVLTWEPFSNAYSGYIVEIARDPLFNNLAYVGLAGAPYQHSYALKDSLADNSEGTGYWWRVVPCSVEEEDGPCLPIYNGASAGLPLSYGLGGFSDMGVAQTFTKASAVQTTVVTDFEGAAPLIKFARSDVASSDYEGWSRGLHGAKYYEVQLARDPFFNEELVTINTTIPRVVPFKPTDDGEIGQLPEGLWYFRVRGVDRTGLEGAWSEVSSFNKRISAPSVSVSGGGPREGDGMTLSWSPVIGATSYDFQWSSDPTFEQPGSSATTLQPSYYVPNTTTGTFYWRVRATVNGVSGQWSAAKGPITIVAPTTLKYALTRPVLNAREVTTIHGQLNVAGSPTNGKTLQLLRKTTGCESASGAYNQVGEQSTGVDTDDGMATFRQLIRSNACYRLAWISDSSVVYGAPFLVKARPVTRMRLHQTRVRRGSSFCATVSFNTPVTGRLRFQYRVGRTWMTNKTVNIRNASRKVQCMGIFRAGRFPTRVVVDRMVQGDWKKFEDTVRGGGTIRVNDYFRIVR